MISLCSLTFNDDFSRLFLRRPTARHAVATIGAKPVAHGCWEPWLVEFGELIHPAAWVSAMAVEPGLQRQGLGRAVLDALVGDFGEVRIGVLSAAVPEYYERLGWSTWPGGVLRDGQDPAEPIMVRIGAACPVLDQTCRLRVLSRSELARS